MALIFSRRHHHHQGLLIIIYTRERTTGRRKQTREPWSLPFLSMQPVIHVRNTLSPFLSLPSFSSNFTTPCVFIRCNRFRSEWKCSTKCKETGSKAIRLNYRLHVCHHYTSIRFPLAVIVCDTNSSTVKINVSFSHCVLLHVADSQCSKCVLARVCPWVCVCACFCNTWNTTKINQSMMSEMVTK